MIIYGENVGDNGESNGYDAFINVTDTLQIAAAVCGKFAYEIQRNDANLA